MKFGTSSPLRHKSPQQWAEQQITLGCTAVVFPLDSTAPQNLIDEYKNAAENYELTIAEVGIWRNALSKNAAEREKNMNYCIEQLQLADYLNARCAVNVAGAFGERWDGGYRENFSNEAWKQTVNMVQTIIDKAKPQKTYFTLEPMPWMIPTGPQDYLKLIQDVGQERFAVHLDIINMINSAERYFHAKEFVDECISLLGDKIRSCHIKDIHLKQKYTLQLEECAPGNGEFPLKYYIDRINETDSNIPIILEHLTTDREYIKYMKYIKSL